jgi:hypothetical protein
MHLFFTSPSSAYFLWCLGLLSPPPEHRRHGVQARVKRPQDPKAGSQGCPTQSMSNQEHVQALGAWGEQAGVRAGLRPEMHWCMPEGKQTRKQCVKGWGVPLCTWKPHGHRSKEGAACSPLTSSRRDGRVKLGTLSSGVTRALYWQLALDFVLWAEIPSAFLPHSQACLSLPVGEGK